MAPHLAPIGARIAAAFSARPSLAHGSYGCGGVGRADVFEPGHSGVPLGGRWL